MWALPPDPILFWVKQEMTQSFLLPSVEVRYKAVQIMISSHPEALATQFSGMRGMIPSGLNNFVPFCSVAQAGTPYRQI
jgi:hypothetical protein